MALSVGSSNTTKYFTTPFHSDFYYPDSDWAWVGLVFIRGSGTNREILSHGNLDTVDSLTINLGSGDSLRAWYERLGYEVVTNIPHGEWIFISVRRMSGVLYVSYIQIGGSSVTSSTGLSVTSGVSQPTSGGFSFLARSDNTLHYQGVVGYLSYITDTVSDGNLISLANGVPLLSILQPVDVIFPIDSTLSSFKSLIKNHEITMVGSSYASSDDHFVPMPGNKHAIYEYTIGGQTVVDVWPVDVGNEIHDMDSDTFKFALLDDSFTPAPSDLAPHFGGTGTTDYSASEVIPGGNYPVGGVTLSSLDYSNSAGVTTWSANKILISQNASNPTNARWGVIYNDTDVNKRVVTFTDLVENRNLTSGNLEIRFNGVDGVGAIFTQTVNV